ncbi:hypothetical protein VE03_09055 [Pseudogymnoascus sp. 23342-1-I1]|nr:hypothetical protein VE03_09055 [Pseudogymnoascus sp. 23342-1-I1]
MAKAFSVQATIASFGGNLLKLEHNATSTGSTMKLNLFLPAQAEKGKVPVIFYLAGLTCTGDNGAEKGFFQATASTHGIAIVYPDTSPRGLGVQGEDESWDFGTGAGFYLDATKGPYSAGYKMSSYITKELPIALYGQFENLDSSRVSIMGHSMGGHGALTLFLRNPGMFKSVSAFAPISNPKNCPWGQKAFGGYLKSEDEYDDWDATELIKKWGGDFEALIDVGDADNFYKHGQLLPENFIEAAKSKGKADKIDLRIQKGYDHSYFFISTFSEDHVNYHAKRLL